MSLGSTHLAVFSTDTRWRVYDRMDQFSYPGFFIPHDIIPSGDAGPLGSRPSPSAWGIPTTSFERGCDFDAHVKNQRIVLNTDFCGSWLEVLWYRGQLL
jgi:hypothetical protein